MLVTSHWRPSSFSALEQIFRENFSEVPLDVPKSIVSLSIFFDWPDTTVTKCKYFKLRKLASEHRTGIWLIQNGCNKIFFYNLENWHLDTQPDFKWSHCYRTILYVHVTFTWWDHYVLYTERSKTESIRIQNIFMFCIGMFGFQMVHSKTELSK